MVMMKTFLAPILVALAIGFGASAEEKCVSIPELPGGFFGIFVLEKDRDEDYDKYLTARGVSETEAQLAMRADMTKVFRPALTGMPTRYDLEEWTDLKTVIYSNWALGERFVLPAPGGEKYPITFSLNGNVLKEVHSAVGDYKEETFEYTLDGDELTMEVKCGNVVASRYFKKQRGVCATQDVPEKFLGTFVLNKSMDVNYEEHLRARGFSNTTIKFVRSQSVTKILRRAKSEQPHRFDMLKKTPMLTVEFDDWALNEQFTGPSLTGKPLRITFTVSEDQNTLTETRVSKTAPYEKDVINLTVEDDYLVMTNSYNNVEAKRYYKKQADKA